MEEILKIKLWYYIQKNNPDLMLSIQEEHVVLDYLNEKVNNVRSLLEDLQSEGKPRSIIEETCLHVLTEDLKPSRFVYIRSILEAEFEPAYVQFSASGILQYEVVNLMEDCKDIFETIGFTTESEENPTLKYAIMGQISDYLNETIYGSV